MEGCTWSFVQDDIVEHPFGCTRVACLLGGALLHRPYHGEVRARASLALNLIAIVVVARAWSPSPHSGS